MWQLAVGLLWMNECHLHVWNNGQLCCRLLLLLKHSGHNSMCVWCCCLLCSGIKPSAVLSVGVDVVLARCVLQTQHSLV
jgi:hypothetical protein